MGGCAWKQALRGACRLFRLTTYNFLVLPETFRPAWGTPLCRLLGSYNDSDNSRHDPCSIIDRFFRVFIDDHVTYTKQTPIWARLVLDYPAEEPENRQAGEFLGPIQVCSPTTKRLPQLSSG
jgi:hypothetical protein